MVLNTMTVGAAVTPTVVQTCISHYLNRKPLRQKPTAHISYHEGLRLIRQFLVYASHHTVEEIQAFTSQGVPHPRWVKVDEVTIPPNCLEESAQAVIAQLGHKGVDYVGGSRWWQWRRKNSDLHAEWIEMRGDYNARKKIGDKGRRVMLYVHGGAYFFGSVDEHRYQMQRHARKLRARVFAPRYRLAPQFPFPCGLHDCLAAYLYLLTVQSPSEIILAGDSAGGGMILSMLVMLRDRGLPLPAGAVLISPWVDLTHSFPSVAGDNAFDYIPAYGFMQRPSAAWPPPSSDEMEAISTAAIEKVATKDLSKHSTHRQQNSSVQDAVQGFAVHDPDHVDPINNPNNPAGQRGASIIPGDTIPGPGRNLSIMLDGSMIEIKDQIQMYAPNHLLSHPLVSPVLQPSLGGLPPLLILTGGGEVLRDEQIYLAHKAANPSRYPPGPAYLAEYDPDGTVLNKYKPTDVQLQVWDDLCHVAPTLSFTRPAKYMYRSIAQFSAWALARAQKTSIEILDDDDVSFISSDSNSSSSSTSTLAQRSKKHISEALLQIGKAGDPLPSFKNHMIRQRVDRHGTIYPLAPPSDLPGLQLPAAEIGVIKPGPVRKWLAARKAWDSKYASQKRRVRDARIRAIAAGLEEFGGDEVPPPSALAGRRSKLDEREEKKRKSWGMMLWSLWGSKHDEDTIKREEEADKLLDTTTTEARPVATEAIPEGAVEVKTTTTSRPRGHSIAKHHNAQGRTFSGSRSPSRRGSQYRTRRRTVTDAGQAEAAETVDDDHNLDALHREQTAITEASVDENRTHGHTQSNPSPSYIPFPLGASKNLSHLRPETASLGEVSTMTDREAPALRNASTTAVFSAPGVAKQKPLMDDGATTTTRASIRSKETGADEDAAMNITRPGSPASKASVHRLQANQTEAEAEADGEIGGAKVRKRNVSNVAIAGAEGVVQLVEEDAGHLGTEKEKENVQLTNGVDGVAA